MAPAPAPPVTVTERRPQACPHPEIMEVRSNTGCLSPPLWYFLYLTQFSNDQQHVSRRFTSQQGVANPSHLRKLSYFRVSRHRLNSLTLRLSKVPPAQPLSEVLGKPSDSLSSIRRSGSRILAPSNIAIRASVLLNISRSIAAFFAQI